MKASAAAFTTSVSTAPPASRPRPIGPGDPMPYGKHKGVPVEQVPRDYLSWCLREMDACRPDSDRYWPEFTGAIQGIVGSQPTGVTRPCVMAFQSLLALLAAGGLKIRADRGEVFLVDQNGRTGVTVPEGVPDAIRVHKASLLAVIALVEPRQASGNGSAKLLWAADLRCRVKAWYGQLSRQFHPDSGGSPDRFVVLNQCYRSVMEVLNEWESKP